MGKGSGNCGREALELVTKASESIWSNPTSLELLGTSAEELKALNCHTCPRSFTVGYFETPDGEPIAGLVYQTDYRAEEEYGIGELRRALTGKDPRNFEMTPKARDKIKFFSDANALVLSTSSFYFEGDLKWGDSLSEPGRKEEEGKNLWHDSYVGHFERSLPYMQELKGAPEHGDTVKELKAKATKLGIHPMPNTKAKLKEAILKRAVETQSGPELWPGWFHYGDKLVLRAEGSGLSARMIAKLKDAVEHGTLGIGNGSGGFSTGLFFYDTRDETPGLKKERNERFDWLDEQNAKLEPIKQELKSQGIRWFALGRPTLMKDQESGEQVVKYWLNGQGSPQPYGWYSLEELKAKKFLKDVKSG